MNTNIEVLRELDELVEAARLLGVTQAKKLFGCHTDEDRRFERAMYESIDKHRAALLDWEAEPPSAPEPEVHSYDPTEHRESVTIRWPDGKCLGYVLDRTRYTDNQPPSAPVGVDFAAVASILRRAMRDGVHYGYRRDFILQQALALEALSQQQEPKP